MSRKGLYLDFEFNRIVEPKLNLVCCATYDEKSGRKIKWWLHNDLKMQVKLVKYLSEYDEFFAYSAIAECRSLMAVGMKPLDFEWLDLFLEYRMMTNHNDKLQWGDQLVDGKVKPVRKPRPKWQQDEDEAKSGFRATHSLAEATFKLTGEIRDTAEKTKMRNLIISSPKRFTAQQKKDIMDYCLDDVVFLPEIRKRLWQEFHKLAPRVEYKQYKKEALWRGRYAAHTALMENRGYPIHYDKTKNFSKAVGSIIYDLQREINKNHPGIKPFRWERKDNRYAWDQKNTKKWVADNHNVSKWMKTKKGEISLCLEAFEKFYSFKHDYPIDNFGAQMVRFLKMKQSLYGFVPGKKKEKGKIALTGIKKKQTKTFWDSVGSDQRVRPYMNIYMAQSSRSQPAATGFMFLKPAWMRALVEPPPGYFMAGLDYGQQEFFLSALKSNDKNMIKAYLSGDPYLYGAKLAGVIPKHGTKETHGLVRDVFKNTYLGILFGMTKVGLAIKLTADTGRAYTEDEAQAQIDLFEETFPDYMIWKKDELTNYQNNGRIRLPDGWYMWGDNDNPRSAQNVPIQGFGAAIMRKAVDLAQTKGIKIAFTLHDALYMEDKIGNEYKIEILRQCMIEAFIHYFEKEKTRDLASSIKIDPKAWSPSYKSDSVIKLKSGLVIPASNLYIDKRSQNDYEKFSQYFEAGSEQHL